MCEIVAKAAKDFDGDDRWMCLHNRFIIEAIEKDAEVLFIGDSVLASIENLETWNEFFIPFHCLNFSIYGDLIENVLWRLQNGELDHIQPKAIILHVGTNDVVQNEPTFVFNGILNLISVIRDKQPDAYLILPTLLPRGKYPNKLREKIDQVNNLLVDDNNLPDNNCHVVRIDEDFIQSDNTISHYDMYDYFLLTNAGCRRAFQPIQDLLSDLLIDITTAAEIDSSSTST